MLMDRRYYLTQYKMPWCGDTEIVLYREIRLF